MDKINEENCFINTSGTIDSKHQMEQEKDIPGNNVLLRKLDEALSDPLHHRLLSAYAYANASSAKAAMEQELACILLEVLDRVDSISSVYEAFGVSISRQTLTLHRRLTVVHAPDRYGKTGTTF